MHNIEKIMSIFKSKHKEIHISKIHKVSPDHFHNTSQYKNEPNLEESDHH